MNYANLFGVEEESVDSKYTAKTTPPQYVPSATSPNLYECVNTVKYEQIMQDIQSSNVNDKEKEFLKLAATRHIKFTYSKIADYYAHASKEMQELMEQSALVIIDLEDAIANGYVKLSKNIERIMKESGKPSVKRNSK